MFSKLKYDLPASIVVFLVALPLCLGVALASGAPLLSGIISGIIGGIVVGLISKSQTSVSGPAAGLAAVVISSITELGSFEIFLSAVIIAGVIQIVLGFLKAGVMADYIPSNVIKGLLAAIGIILILKQIPHAIGFDKSAFDSFSFVGTNGENTLSGVFKAFHFIEPGALLISVISILILVFWDKTFLKKVKFLPASLFVVTLGIVLNLLFITFFPNLSLEKLHLVNIPPIDTNNLDTYFHFPDINNFGNYHVWMVAVIIALIASLETLLNMEAVHKIDPEKRDSSPNRELMAQGVGNILAGFFGGIPVTSVIVRSSVNIQSGNKTKASAILHGVFMLMSVLLLSPFLNLIPLASLAAILLTTGYKLAKITILKDMYVKGWHQLLPAVVTTVAIIFTDLLIGVLIGFVINIFYFLRSNFRNPFIKEKSNLHVGEVIRLDLPSQVYFFNKASIKETLWEAPENSKIIIDASHSDFIDNDVLEIVDEFKNEIAPKLNIRLNIIGLKKEYQPSDYIQFNNVLDKETQQKLSPNEILEHLKSGNNRFVNGVHTNKYFLNQIDTTSTGQNPMAVILGCIDSRTSPELLFDTGLGDILSIRIAGNIISPEIFGSLEIAVEKLGAKLIVVKGHSNCGAVSLSLKNDHHGNMGIITDKIQRAINQCDKSQENYVEQVTKQNVLNSIEDILANSPSLRAKVENKEIGIVSAYHDISTGKVYFGDIEQEQHNSKFDSQKEETLSI
jgi:carbonic anhydrase